jgi:hypothetical protein
MLKCQRRRSSAATAPASSDLIRLPKTSDLCQRPISAVMPLVHTEEVTGSSGGLVPIGGKHPADLLTDLPDAPP